MIVERRDQVRMMSLRPLARSFSTLSNRYPSTNGPFQTERDMGSASPLLGEVAAADDHVRGLLVPARLVALGRLAPRADRVAAAGGPALAAAVRMIDRIH